MLRNLWSTVFEASFFSNDAVQVALIIGAVVSVVSALVGTFTVIRGQSFAGHSLADIGSAGGSAAFLVGVPTFYEFVACNVAAAAVMELIGIRRPRGRDLATGIVLGAALGLAALFLYLDTTASSTTGATNSILFGSLFTVDPSIVPVVSLFGIAVVAVIAALFRPLLLTAVSYDLAAVRGVPVRLVGAAYLLTLAVAVSLSAVTIGAILSTALLIGPAATSLRVTARTGPALIVAAVLGLVATWAGILIAYDSADWDASGQGLPVSFCIVCVVFALYLLAALPARYRSARLARQISAHALTVH